MKKKLFIFAMVITGAIAIFNINAVENGMGDVSLQYIEMLSSGETGGISICIGTGSIDCQVNKTCENTSDKDNLFPVKKNIISDKMNVGEYLGKINSMKCVNKNIVITGKNTDSQTQGLLINKETKDHCFFGETGEGPGRLIQIAAILPLNNDQIGIYDLGKRTL